MGNKGTRRLGRGLSSLIPADLGVAADARPTLATDSMGTRDDENVDGLRGRPSTDRVLASTLPIDRIRTNPSQPRRDFDPERLAALAESIRLRGALQPVVVRPAEGGYELVAGERRLRAARIAEVDEIPVIVREVSDNDMLELALVENVHRENLNPVEKASAYSGLVEKHGLSHEEIARRMGEDRSSVANTIRLLGLSDPSLDLLREGKLSVGHGKALLAITDPVRQASVAEQIAREGWSVRRAEQAASEQRGDARPDARKSKPAEPRPAVREMEERLSGILGTRVSLREGRRRHSGKIIIEYYNLEDFERITEALGLDGDSDSI